MIVLSGGSVTPPWRQAGFQLPVVLGLILLVAISSTLLINSVLTSQQLASNQAETELVDTLSNKVLLEAQTNLMQTTAVPSVQSNVGALTVAVDGAINTVWSPTITNRQLIASEDRITGEPLVWWYQGDTWWQMYGTQSKLYPQASFTVEFYGRPLGGTEIGQPETYTSTGSRIIFTVTATGAGPRHAKAVKQINVTRIFNE